MEAISILIYNRNQSERSAALARSLTRIKLSEGVSPKRPWVMVLDDGSLIEDRKALEVLPGAVERQFNPTRRGFAWAVNQFVSLTEADAYLVLNPGIQLQKDELLAFVRALEENPTLAAASPTLRKSSDESTHPSIDLGDTASLESACFLIRKKSWEEVGPIPEQESPFACLRAWVSLAMKKGRPCAILPSISLDLDCSTPPPSGEQQGAAPTVDRGKKSRVAAAVADEIASSPDLEPWEIDVYRPGDEQAICDCFERTFEKKKPLDIWNWQFRDNPAGIRIFIARTPSGKVVAQFAGVPVRMLLGGKPHTFTQMVDNMVDPAYRQGLRRSGVFSEVVYRYVDHYGNPEGETVGFGLPNPQAYRIGRRLLGYSHIQDVHETTRILTGEDAQRSEVTVPGIEIQVAEKPPLDVTELFNKIASNYSLIAIRDHQYLQWRYEQSPLDRFLFVTARRTSGSNGEGGPLIGLAVLKTSYLEDQGTSAIVDWLSLPEETEADVAVVRKCEKVAIEHGAGRMVSFFPLYAKEIQLLQSLDYVTEKSNWLLVGRTYHPEVGLEWVSQHWHYTLGDFDLV